jgi:hypothetical protein
MAYNEYLADRIRQTLHEKKAAYIDKPMMGGLVFMVDSKMCVGIIKEDLMVRIDPEIEKISLQKPGSRLMDFTGKSMHGFLMISPEGIDKDEDLEFWIQLALDFNPVAKASKPKKKRQV